MRSIDQNKQPDQSPENLKEKFEKVTNSNGYSALVLAVGVIGLILELLFHKGVKYADKDLLLMLLYVFCIATSLYRLRKNYLKKRADSTK